MESNIGFLTSFWGGFSSFFSIWQVCILQISPFFMAFIIARYLIDENAAITDLLVSGIGYLIGFSITFAILGSSSLYLSSYLLYNIKVFRIISGIFVILVGIFIITVGVLRHLAPLAINRIFLLVSLLLGASFAIAYSPCIPPVLSNILNFASIPQNAAHGFVFLAAYGIGLSAAFIITGIFLSLLAGMIVEKIGKANIMIAGSAFVLMAMGFMTATGLMVYYKAFLLGFFVK